MTTPLDTARESLAVAELAHATALADAAEARRAFEANPTPKRHADLAVKEQRARNAAPVVETARAEVERVRRAGLAEQLAEARGRASHARLLDATAPHRARLLELFDAVLGEVASIETTIRAQHQAVHDAETIARELGEHAAAPSRVAVTLIRAMVGVELAHKLYRLGARFALGREPWTFIAPRWDRGATPDQDEIRRARKLALPVDAFLPAASVDFMRDSADVAPWHETPQSRPQRYEVT